LQHAAGILGIDNRRWRCTPHLTFEKPPDGCIENASQSITIASLIRLKP